jgi:hypothetical protein
MPGPSVTVLESELFFPCCSKLSGPNFCHELGQICCDLCRACHKLGQVTSNLSSSTNPTSTGPLLFSARGLRFLSASAASTVLLVSALRLRHEMDLWSGGPGFDVR